MVRIQFLKISTPIVLLILFLTAISCNGTEPDTTVIFDAPKAFDYLESQMAFGPRVPGTDAHQNARDWIHGQLKQYTSQVSLQSFTGAVGDTNIVMYNILSSFYPERGERVLLCAHWDSRYTADKDPDPSNHSLPVPGANDGASGVAVLLEIASIIAEHDPGIGVDIVFFDGEDGGAYGDNESWLLGSRYFAQTMPAGYKPTFALLLDMIGDKNLGLERDMRSINSAPVLWRRILAICGERKIPVSSDTMSIIDDHVPLIERGIPAVDLIDFDYPSWHTIADTTDKCSPESLKKIGELVLDIVYERD